MNKLQVINSMNINRINKEIKVIMTGTNYLQGFKQLVDDAFAGHCS